LAASGVMLRGERKDQRLFDNLRYDAALRGWGMFRRPFGAPILDSVNRSAVGFPVSTKQLFCGLGQIGK